MKRSRICRNLPVTVLAVFGMVMSFSSDANADIAPEMYENLLKNAEEVLIVELRSVVDVKHNGVDGERVRVQVKAVIRSVERSSSNLKSKDELTFESYYIKDGAHTKKIMGPQSPPRLEAGGVYRVFLSKKSPSSTMLGPAAYGKSFERLESASKFVSQAGIAPAKALPKAGEMAEVIVHAAKVMDAARVLDEMPQGTKLKVYSIQGVWAEVEIPGSNQRGWVQVTELRAVPIAARNNDQRKPVLSEDQFKKLFLTKEQVPQQLTTHSDYRITDPNPADQQFERQKGVRMGSQKFELNILLPFLNPNAKELVNLVQDIRLEFPTEEAASEYLRLSADALSEGAEKAKGAPRIGDDCQVYGPRNRRFNLQEITGIGTEIFGYIFAFRVENIVVKQFVMVVPDAQGKISIDPAVRMAEKAFGRIEETLEDR